MSSDVVLEIDLDDAREDEPHVSRPADTPEGPAAEPADTVAPQRSPQRRGKAMVRAAQAADGSEVRQPGQRWCKGHCCFHPVEEFGPKECMCREAKGLYEGAMTQARAQNEVKFLKEMLSGRPEEFALFLARFKMEAPRLGRGRVHFNLARFRAYIQSKQGMGGYSGRRK